MTETGNIDFRKIRKYLKLLNGKPEKWIAEQINKAEPFDGSKETLSYLKEMEYERIIVTDNVLTSLAECNNIIKKKLGADRVIPTAKMKLEDENWILENPRTKPEILEGLIEEYKPSLWLCMVQGSNDIGMAEYAKKHGGTVISVNSHSPELEVMSHHHIDSVAEAPGLLERILAK